MLTVRFISPSGKSWSAPLAASKLEPVKYKRGIFGTFTQKEINMLNNNEQNTLDEAVLDSLSWKKQARQAQKDIAALKLANSVILAELEVAHKAIAVHTKLANDALKQRDHLFNRVLAGN